MKQRVTSADVAREAGVSRTTVSYVLNGRTDVGIPEPTRQRVAEAARKLGYRVNVFARSLQKGTAPYIGVVVHRWVGSSTGDFVAGVQEACRERGFGVLVACSKYQKDLERTEVELLSTQAAAVIALPVEPVDYSPDGLWVQTSLSLPVCLATVPPGAVDGIDFVGADGWQSGFVATEHLIRIGHKRIAFLSGVRQASGIMERERGYRDALKKAGIEFMQDLVVGDSYEGLGTEVAVASLLQLPDCPTAVVCASDYIAAEAMQALRRFERRVPEDVAVTGIGDIDLARYLQITSMAEEHEAVGRQAATMVLSRLDDLDQPSRWYKQGTELVVRATCGARWSGLQTPSVTQR